MHPEPRRWVIGRGLLGGAVSAARDDEPYRSAVRWGDPADARADLSAALDGFLNGHSDEWELYWCAGRGVTSTPPAVMAAEADLFEWFIDMVCERAPAELARGSLFLASSVGGAYGGSESSPFTEFTPARPISPYGEVKLRMEATLSAAVAGTSARALIGRITNLYGPGQDLGKGQGLISVIVESYVTGKPASIYVPLDTLRDYIYVDDCARVIDAGMRRLRREPAGTVVTKIIGAMNAQSVGAILGEVARLRRKPVPVMLGQGDASGQTSDLRVKSVVWPELDREVSTTLPEGLGAVHRAQLRRQMLGH